MQMKYVTTICPYCGTGCALNLVVSDGKIVGVAPSHRSPVSFGKLCTRGLHAADGLTEARIEQPFMEKKPTDWEKAISKAAELKKFAAGEIAVITSARLTNENQFLVKKFAKAIGAEISVVNGGAGVSTANLEAIQHADVLLVLGDVMRSLPVTGNRFFHVKDNAGQILYLGPQGYTAIQANHAEITDDYTTIPAEFTSILKAAAHPVVVYLANDAAAKTFADSLKIASAVLYETSNGKGTAAMGIGPLALSDKIKAAFIIAETPQMEMDIYGDLLQKLDALKLKVVLSTTVTSLLGIADVILPIAALHESEGTLTNWEGRLQMTKHASDSVEGVKSLAAVLTDLAAKMGVKIPSGTPEEMFKALGAEIPAFANATYAQITKPEGVFLKEA